MSTRAVTVPAAMVCAAATVLALTSPSAVAAPEPAQPCPALLAIGVQGPGQASADTGPTTDSGIVGEALRPLVGLEQEGLVQRRYVRFRPDVNAASTGNGSNPYEQSIIRGASELQATATEFLTRCPASSIAIVGYAHGAAAASQFAQQVGRGGGGISADRVAAVALLGDPSRNPNTSPLPGSTSRTIPQPVPSTSGEMVEQLDSLAQQPLPGGGISQSRNATADFGQLTGRVASLCVAGDLACDTPEKAPILQVVSNIAGAANDSGGDPLRALASVTQALAFTAIKTATSVINNDVQGNSLASLSLSSHTSLSQRLAEASDPRTPLDINSVLKAVIKVGTIALNAVLTVAKSVITPANLAEIGAAGLANPAAGLAMLGTKLVGALPQLVPPATASRLTNQAFEAVVSNVTDNSGLVDTATWVRYSDAIARRGSYTSDPITSGGASATRFITDWVIAVVRDIAASTTRGGPSKTPASSTPTPATGRPHVGTSTPTTAPARLPDSASITPTSR